MSPHRRYGRPTKVDVNPADGTVTATFQDGAVRRYTQAEIADYAVQQAGYLANGDTLNFDEPWFEFLATVIGDDMMKRLIAVAAILEPDEGPPGLMVGQRPA